MQFVLDVNGYIKGWASMPFGVGGVGSIDLPIPDDFDETWSFCYKRDDDIWVFDEAKKDTVIAEENASLNTPTLEQRLAAAEAALLMMMDMGVL